MENNLIKVLHVKVGEKPIVIEIPDELEPMQKLVGGWIQEWKPWNDDVAIICNEEGKITGLPLNRSVKTSTGLRDIIAGDFFLCYAPMDSESFLSLSDEQIEKYSKIFETPEEFYMLGNDILSRPLTA